MATGMQVRRSPTKFAPADWHTSNFVISSSAERQRAISHDVRQESQKLRNETESITRWTQHNTDSQLEVRLGDITNWKNTLEKTLKDTEIEIDKLTEHKRKAEEALLAKSMPLEVVHECLGLREQRVSIDLVRDEVEGQLHKEFEVIEGIRGMLLHKVNEAFEQICVLQDCHRQLYADLTDKNTAVQIDSECCQLENTSEDIGMQTDPTRIKKGIVTPTQWESYSTHNAAKAESEMKTSLRLRESISHTIQHSTAELEAQWINTNYSFHKRIHEMEQVKQELEWQQNNTEAEIAEVQEEIAGAEQSLADKNPPMMVVQTRLENRTYRPGVELCRDPTQYSMVGEVATIAESQTSLTNKLQVAQQALGTLQRTLERILQDLDVKNNSLLLDQQCMELRKKLSGHANTSTSSQPPCE